MLERFLLFLFFGYIGEDAGGTVLEVIFGPWGMGLRQRVVDFAGLCHLLGQGLIREYGLQVAK